MIYISPHISLLDNELQWKFARAGGPGGQNVNKVSTAVELRFNIYRSSSIPYSIRHRLIQLAGSRMTQEGILIIKSRQFRSQDQNRQYALDQLIELIKRASHKPKPRKKTKPSRSAKKKRLERKKTRGKIKSLRRPITSWDE